MNDNAPPNRRLQLQNLLRDHLSISFACESSQELRECVPYEEVSSAVQRVRVRLIGYARQSLELPAKLRRCSYSTCSAARRGPHAPQVAHDELNRINISGSRHHRSAVRTTPSPIPIPRARQVAHDEFIFRVHGTMGAPSAPHRRPYRKKSPMTNSFFGFTAPWPRRPHHIIAHTTPMCTTGRARKIHCTGHDAMGVKSAPHRRPYCEKSPGTN